MAKQLDQRGLEIKIKHIKSDLDAVVEFNKKDDASIDTDKIQEYLDDCINNIKELKKRL